MGNRPASLTSIFAPAAENAWRLLVNSLRPQIPVPARTYRPEKYYMRGPVRNGVRSIRRGSRGPRLVGKRRKSFQNLSVSGCMEQMSCAAVIDIFRSAIAQDRNLDRHQHPCRLEK